MKKKTALWASIPILAGAVIAATALLRGTKLERPVLAAITGIWLIWFGLVCVLPAIHAAKVLSTPI